MTASIATIVKDVDKQDLANHLADRLGSPISLSDIKRFKILDITGGSRWIFVKMATFGYDDIETHLIMADDFYAESQMLWEEKEIFKWDVKSLISHIKTCGGVPD